jgi:hypothetical protein
VEWKPEKIKEQVQGTAAGRFERMSEKIEVHDGLSVTDADRPTI